MRGKLNYQPNINTFCDWFSKTKMISVYDSFLNRKYIFIRRHEERWSNRAKPNWSGLILIVFHCHNTNPVHIGRYKPLYIYTKNLYQFYTVFHRDPVKMTQIGLVLLDDKFLLTLLTKEWCLYLKTVHFNNNSKWITLALSESRSSPMVNSSLHTLSKLSSSPARSSLNTHSCIMSSGSNWNRSLI